ncbi:hypothetical protein PR048_021128 [Dryococelus australis]|uniref:Uncharacterized protein n=1 Tax=Dryococelus australis TaxID=614101 RepID=A0ABQ9GXH7_9NEOP|nr:hypothetical protein PR048_021128 [Dryococelus australis]
MTSSIPSAKHPSVVKLRIVEAPAEIILEDIRSKLYNNESYPSDGDALNDMPLLPETIRCLLEKVIKTKSNTDHGICLKRAAIGQAKKNNTLGDGYVQYPFDNADFNVRTMTGHGTFRSMGGLRFTTPPPSIPSYTIPHVMSPPPVSDVFVKGKIPTQLKGVMVRELRTVSEETYKSVKTATVRDTFCMSGMWAAVTSPPSWNVCMRRIFNSGEVYFLGNQAHPVPFINLDPGNPSTIYSALIFANDECQRKVKVVVSSLSINPFMQKPHKSLCSTLRMWTL